MGLIKGSGSFTRFMVDGTIPENYMDEFPPRISRYAFRSIDEESIQERSAGWVNIMDMLDSGFQRMEYLKEPCIAMSWRVDERKVPAKALLRYAREAEDKIKAAEALEFLPKQRRKEIKDVIGMKLLKRVIPRSRTFDTIWNFHTGVLIFGSTNNKLCDDFAEFFFKCFQLHLKAVYPYTLAAGALQRLGLSPDLLDSLHPLDFSEVR